MTDLRDYQIKAVADIEHETTAGRNVLFTLPTGAGKTDWPTLRAPQAQPRSFERPTVRTRHALWRAPTQRVEPSPSN